MKRPISGLVIVMLAVGMLALAFCIKPVNPSPATITVPDDYSTIQAAINAASPGVTVYVRAGAYPENVVVGKALSLVGENPQNTIINGGGVGSVVDINADSVKVMGFKLQNGGAFYPNAGISLDNAKHCNITENNITANNFDGITLEYSSSNSISGNNITANNFDGISLDSSPSNSISGNNMTNNGYGIVLFDSSNSSISGNNITANNGHGILLDYSSNSSISGNNITANNGEGIRLQSSSGNSIFHNSFVNNNPQFSSSDLANVWDDGYPSGGNYWGDYVARYPNASETDGSGVWNTPYVIDANNIDRYPLMSSIAVPEFPAPIFLFLCMLAPSVAIVALRRKWHTLGSKS